MLLAYVCFGFAFSVSESESDDDESDDDDDDESGDVGFDDEAHDLIFIFIHRDKTAFDNLILCL